MQESLYKQKSWVPNDNTSQEKEEAVFYTCVKQNSKTTDFVNFHFKDGKQKALPTSSISELEYIPSKGTIVIYCGYAVATIMGKHLEELYRKLLSLKVVEIREFSEQIISLDPDQLTISEITIESSLENQQYH